MNILISVNRCKNGPSGRFGGGWSRALGIRWGWPTVLVDLFSFTVRVEVSR